MLQELSAIVLAGGLSSRFPPKKCTSKPFGYPLIERVISSLADISAEILVVGRSESTSSELSEVANKLGCRLVYDEQASNVQPSDKSSLAVYPADSHSQLPRAPILGVISGLSQATKELCIVVGCDMPFICSRLFLEMAELLGDGLACVPFFRGTLQPLHAVYSRKILEPLIAGVRQGVLSIRRFLANFPVDITVFTRKFSPREELSFLSIDSPTDVLKLKSDIDNSYIIYWEKREKEKTLMAEGPVTKDMLIGEVLDKHPESAPVIQKYFGFGCFTCPGMRMESIDMGALMHGVDPDKVVDEINASCRKEE